jgi:hypothetical protein
MARGERQEDGNRGGVGTMTRLGPRQRPQRAQEGAPAAADPRRGRQARPVPPPRAEPAPRQAASGPAADRRVPAPAEAARRRGAPSAPAPGPLGAPPRPAAPARPPARTRTGAPWRVPPARRVTVPEPARATGPQPAVPPAQPAGAARSALAAPHRMPFVLLLCGLLGGALVSALVISTTLAEGSFQISKLQDSTSSLARQRQTLEEQVAQAQSAPVIEQRASQLGMRRPGELLFLDLKTGKTTNDGPTWIGAVNAPGYAP